MAVIVDPARLDPHHRGRERREKGGFRIGAFEHGVFINLAGGAGRKSGGFHA